MSNAKEIAHLKVKKNVSGVAAFKPLSTGLTKIWVKMSSYNCIWEWLYKMAMLRSVIGITPKSPFLCVNRSPVRCAFRAGARVIWYGLNAEFVAESLACLSRYVADYMWELCWLKTPNFLGSQLRNCVLKIVWGCFQAIYGSDTLIKFSILLYK